MSRRGLLGVAVAFLQTLRVRRQHPNWYCRLHSPRAAQRRPTMPFKPSVTNAGSIAGTLMDRVTGTAKRFAGAVLGDEQLKREGTLHHAKADVTRLAAERAAG